MTLTRATADSESRLTAEACPSRDEARRPRALRCDRLRVDRARDIGGAGLPDAMLRLLMQTAERTMTRAGVGHISGGSDLIKPGAVLAPIKAAARRLRRWPTASLDRSCARRCRVMQAGAGKRPTSRTEKR